MFTLHQATLYRLRREDYDEQFCKGSFFCYDQIDFLSHATIDNVMYRLSYLFLSFLYPHFAF